MIGLFIYSSAYYIIVYNWSIIHDYDKKLLKKFCDFQFWLKNCVFNNVEFSCYVTIIFPSIWQITMYTKQRIEHIDVWFHNIREFVTTSGDVLLHKFHINEIANDMLD